MDIEHILKKSMKKQEPQGDKIFALDIGTRTVVGIIGERVDDKYHIIDCVVAPHTRRAMVDGQIEDIKQVAKIVGQVKEKLEQRNGMTLSRACIAAAGRTLKTVNISKAFDVSGSEIITEEMVASMEMETISAAQAELDEITQNEKVLFYCVGHNVVTYRLDNYKMISVNGHKGSHVEIDMVVAFLPGIVVESLYSVMELNGLEVQSLTLEPIAAMNVIVPQEIRLINIALVDIGAGTSDIAIAKDGSIIAYAMATVAGDEITEDIIRNFLVDFTMAEQMKCDADNKDTIEYRDIFGMAHTVEREDFIEKILPCMDVLAGTICDTILKINGESPQAVFLVGGGSLINGLTTLVADKLNMDESHVAVGGSEFLRDVDTGDYKMGAEFITPIGIGVTALNDRGYDFSVINVNGKKVRVFDTKKLTVYQLLSLAGYKAGDIMGHSGQGLSFILNGNKVFRKGTLMAPAEIKVNGNGAGLTTVVTQGDSVEFIPAKNGENARTTLSEEIDYQKYRSGTVRFGDKEYKFGIEATVNGEKKTPKYEIQPLDNIVIGGILTLGDLLSNIGVEYEESFAINGEYAEEAALLSDGDVITLKMRSAAPTRETAPEPAREAAPAPFREVPAAAGRETALVRDGDPAREAGAARAAAVGEAGAVRAAAPARDAVTARSAGAAPVKGTVTPAARETAAVKGTTDEDEPEIEVYEAPRKNSAAKAYDEADEPRRTPPTLAELYSNIDEDLTFIEEPEELPPPPPVEEGPSPADIVPPITINLNGRPLTLPEKTDGTPHTFLEVLSYVDIDTKNPVGKDVELTLNGVEINFSQELKAGDNAIVRWRD